MTIYEPVDSNELEKARLAYEAANAYPKLLEQQRGYECQSNQYFQRLLLGDVIEVLIQTPMGVPSYISDFWVNDGKFERGTSGEEIYWNMLLELLECPQIEWRYEGVQMDWYTCKRAYVKGE